MATFTAVKSANAATTFPFKPVALFVGGTSGIGQGAVEAFARYTKGNADIFVSGRNETAARDIISKFPKPTDPSSTFRHDFLRCDATTIAGVTSSCKDFRENYGVSKLNYLFLCQGALLWLFSYSDNGEGIDYRSAVNFYSRFKFIVELMPLLEAAKAAGEEARVVTVLNAGIGAPVNIDDLYGKLAGAKQFIYGTSTKTGLGCEAFAERYPGMSFTHIFPGRVSTHFGSNWKPFYWFSTITSFFPPKKSKEVCAEYMLRPLFDPSMATGAHHLWEHAEPLERRKLYLDTPGQRDAVWAHLVEVLGEPSKSGIS